MNHFSQLIRPPKPSRLWGGNLISMLFASQSSEAWTLLTWLKVESRWWLVFLSFFLSLKYVRFVRWIRAYMLYTTSHVSLPHIHLTYNLTSHGGWSLQTESRLLGIGYGNMQLVQHNWQIQTLHITICLIYIVFGAHVNLLSHCQSEDAHIHDSLLLIFLCSI